MIRARALLPFLLLAATPASAAGPLVATPPTLSSEAAYRLLEHAQKAGDARGYANCIAIADANGNLLAFVRRGNTAPGCVESLGAGDRGLAVADALLFRAALARTPPAETLDGSRNSD